LTWHQANFIQDLRACRLKKLRESNYSALLLWHPRHTGLFGP
jgi:hypothetical protein